MSTSLESTISQQMAGANQYTFTDHDGATRIVFYPHKPGPVVADQLDGPELTYKGPEGQFYLLQRQHQRPRGAFWIVNQRDLRRNRDPRRDRTVSEVFFGVAAGERGERKKQSFLTFGIKTASTIGGVSEGAQFNYTVVPLNGLAEMS